LALALFGALALVVIGSLIAEAASIRDQAFRSVLAGNSRVGVPRFGQALAGVVLVRGLRKIQATNILVKSSKKSSTQNDVLFIVGGICPIPC
jgi:hypothetical protein